ncbi:hypothetical protein ACFV3R_25105 [Streptomyces sp. NPDC059740]|uniref:hypothetical protein n=1 Tax=Streptomyces sp. NPDC059740 TaxID=3346926 RepID=UPI003655B991
MSVAVDLPQQHAHQALQRLLAAGAAAGLPALQWTIGEDGRLTGDATGLTRTAEQQRADLEAWARHLRVMVRRTDDDLGAVHLRATFRRRVQGVELRGRLVATLFPAV